VYADVDGKICDQAPGRIPIRGQGDGRWPAPGWDPAYDWTGFIPFAALPNELNPADGEIVTANQAVIGPQYPYLLTDDWAYGYRSQRIRDLLGVHRRLSVADMRQIQFDSYNSFAPVLVPALLHTPVPSGAAKAVDLLKDWDFREPAESPARSSAAAAFFNATLRHLILRIYDELPAGYKPGGSESSWELIRTLLATPASPWWDDKSTKKIESMTDNLTAAMSDAVAELSDKLGREPGKWRWGDLHTLTLTNETFGQSGIGPIEWLFNRGPVRVAGGGGLVNATNWTAEQGYEVNFVPSMRMIVDMSNLDGSRWVQLTGDSGHAFQDNYTDQLELWRTGQDLPMRWTRATIEAAAKHTMTLEPASAK
jgi:penicillin amidase